MVILIAIATFVSTMLGGIFAMRLRDKLHLILGFSAGAVIAVAFFDLLPESLNIGTKYYSANTIIAIVAIGFLAYLVLDRLAFLHSHTHEVDHDHEHEHGGDTERGMAGNDIGGTISSAQMNNKLTHRGILGAGSLSLHSLLDGVAIGLAFQVSTVVGGIVAVAVLTHDFSDGINTVNMVMKSHGNKSSALRWLLADAVAPVIGVLLTFFVTVPEQYLCTILALFAGFFLYIGASDLVPESYHAHPKFLTTVMTLLGAGVLYGVITVANF